MHLKDIRQRCRKFSLGATNAQFRRDPASKGMQVAAAREVIPVVSRSPPCVIRLPNLDCSQDAEIWSII